MARIEDARRRSDRAKRVLAVAAAASFGAALLLAHASHPGRAASGTTATGASSNDASADDSFGFDQGSFGSSDTTQPDVQSSVS